MLSPVFRSLLRPCAPNPDSDRTSSPSLSGFSEMAFCQRLPLPPPSSLVIPLPGRIPRPFTAGTAPRHSLRHAGRTPSLPSPLKNPYQHPHAVRYKKARSQNREHGNSSGRFKNWKSLLHKLFRTICHETRQIRNSSDSIASHENASNAHSPEKYRQQKTPSPLQRTAFKILRCLG